MNEEYIPGSLPPAQNQSFSKNDCHRENATFLSPSSASLLEYMFHSLYLCSSSHIRWLLDNLCDAIWLILSLCEVSTASFAGSEYHSSPPCTLHTAFYHYTMFHAGHIFLFMDVTTIRGDSWQAHLLFTSSSAYIKICTSKFIQLLHHLYHHCLKMIHFPLVHSLLTS